MEQSELTSHFGFEIKLFSTGIFTTLLFELKKRCKLEEKLGIGLKFSFTSIQRNCQFQKVFYIVCRKNLWKNFADCGVLENYAPKVCVSMQSLSVK